MAENPRPARSRPPLSEGGTIRIDARGAMWGRIVAYFSLRDNSGGAEAVSGNNIQEVSDQSFEQDVLQSDKPVLVDYWAEWCGPCKAIQPILEEIAADYGDRLKVARLNIDDNPDTPPKYGIRGIPTLMLFKGGNVEATKVGALSKSQLTAFIDSNV